MDGRYLMRMSGVIATTLVLMCGVAHAQDETKRYSVGVIKVGDRVSADPTTIGKFTPCTVIGVRPNPPPLDTSKVDAYMIRCDTKAYSSVIATSDRVKPLAGGPAAPSWNVVDATKVGPKGSNRYGARNPHVCAPVRGSAITAELAKQAFICGAEKVSGEYLFLVENVSVQVGGPGRYDPRTQTGFANMDTRTPIYPIRGSFIQYLCKEQDADPKSYFYNYGRNCSRYINRKAEGYCYLTTFADWRCSMSDLFQADADKQHYVAPPR